MKTLVDEVMNRCASLEKLKLTVADKAEVSELTAKVDTASDELAKAIQENAEFRQKEVII